MHKNELNRIANAITRNAPAGKDASGMLVECLTDAVVGVTQMLANINDTLNELIDVVEVLAPSESKPNPLVILTEEVDEKHAMTKEVFAAFEHDENETFRFSDALRCRWISWTCGTTRLLELDLPANNYCDMNGAIRTAEALMPDVSLIITQVGGNLDVVYEKLNEEWIAHPAPA